MTANLPTPLAPPEANLPTTRARAIEAGSIRYFSGEQCPQGHVAARYTLSGYCVLCQRIATRNQKLAAKAKRDGA